MNISLIKHFVLGFIVSDIPSVRIRLLSPIYILAIRIYLWRYVCRHIT